LIVQLTSANAAQYSGVSFICHNQSPFFAMSFYAASALDGPRWFGGSNRSSLNSRQAKIETNKQIKEKCSLIQPCPKTGRSLENQTGN